MHVGLDLLFLVPGESGGRETYARRLLAALREIRPDLQVTTFVNDETARAGRGWWSEHADRTLALRSVRAADRRSWAAGELVGVRRAAAAAGVDVLHAPANFAPWGGPFAIVLTLHDVLFRLRPELMSPAMRWGTEALIRPALVRADRVITVSSASAEDIERQLGVPRSRIDVVPNGADTPQAGDATAARTRFGLGDRPIALSVATDLPHKNLPALLEGLRTLAPAERPLLVAAGHGTDTGPLAQRARDLGLEGDVRLLGAVSQADLEDLYRAARIVITATLHEGFGLPVIEAMARGVPVACSDLPVLREVAGTDAVFFDPRDPASIAGALARATAGGADLERLGEAGPRRARTFTWAAAAEATAGAYEAALERRPRRPLRHRGSPRRPRATPPGSAARCLRARRTRARSTRGAAGS